MLARWGEILGRSSNSGVDAGSNSKDIKGFERYSGFRTAEFGERL